MPRKKKKSDGDVDKEQSVVAMGDTADHAADKGYLFVFTDFNVDKTYELTEEIRGIGWGLETCPSTKRKHLQGMIQMKKQSRFKAVIAALGGNVWVKVARGTVEQCKTYCQKEGAYTSVGCFVRQGQRIQGIVENYEQGNTILDIIKNDEEQYKKFHAGIDKIYMHLEDEEFGSKQREMTNIIIWGDSGVGKSTAIRNKHGRENCYSLGDPDGDNKCWNGYTGQSVLILDEFYSWIVHATMLKLLDGEPYQCRGLCKSVYAKFTTIYLTLNEDPRKVLYPNMKGEKRTAFFRRFQKCLEVRRGNIDPSSGLETLLVHDCKMSNWRKPSEFLDLDKDYGGGGIIGMNEIQPTAELGDHGANAGRCLVAGHIVDIEAEGI